MRCLEALEHGADYTLVDAKGRTPSMWLAHNRVEVATVLVELAGDLTLVIIRQHSIAHCNSSRMRRNKIIVTNCGRSSVHEREWETPLDMAQALGHHSCEMIMRRLMNVVGTLDLSFFSADV